MERETKTIEGTPWNEEGTLTILGVPVSKAEVLRLIKKPKKFEQGDLSIHCGALKSLLIKKAKEQCFDKTRYLDAVITQVQANHKCKTREQALIILWKGRDVIDSMVTYSKKQNQSLEETAKQYLYKIKLTLEGDLND